MNNYKKLVNLFQKIIPIIFSMSHYYIFFHVSLLASATNIKCHELPWIIRKTILSKWFSVEIVTTLTILWVWCRNSCFLRSYIAQVKWNITLSIFFSNKYHIYWKVLSNVGFLLPMLQKLEKDFFFSVYISNFLSFQIWYCCPNFWFQDA